MNNIEKKRAKNRVFGFCQVLTLEKKFLGHTLDLNIQGIKIVVPKEFSQESEFQVMLHELKTDDRFTPYITITIKSVWRSSFDQEFDQIGGKIIDVDLLEELEKLMQNFESRLQDIEDNLMVFLASEESN